MTMLVRRLQNLPILYLLIISLLISPAVTSGYAWCVAADKHSFRKEVVAGNFAADSDVANMAFRWGHSDPRQGHQPASLPVGIPATGFSADVPLPERNLNSHRVVASAPRISDQILQHRTIVLLI
jgi:hypothetical protein